MAQKQFLKKISKFSFFKQFFKQLSPGLKMEGNISLNTYSPWCVKCYGNFFGALFIVSFPYPKSLKRLVPIHHSATRKIDTGFEPANLRASNLEPLDYPFPLRRTWSRSKLTILQIHTVIFVYKCSDTNAAWCWLSAPHTHPASQPHVLQLFVSRGSLGMSQIWKRHQTQLYGTVLARSRLTLGTRGWMVGLGLRSWLKLEINCSKSFLCIALPTAQHSLHCEPLLTATLLVPQVSDGKWGLTFTKCSVVPIGPGLWPVPDHVTCNRRLVSVIVCTDVCCLLSLVKY